MSAAPPTAQEFGATLVGIDVKGFSLAVERATLVHGHRAGEAAAAAILPGEAAVRDLLARHGFAFADALGDGAVFLRRGAPPTGRNGRELDELQSTIRRLYLERTGLRVRSAWAHGQVELSPLGVAMSEQTMFLSGAAVADLHARLREVRWQMPRRPSDFKLEGGFPDPGGEIVGRVFVFFRLAAPADWHAVTRTGLAQALDILAGWARGLDGAPDRITQDEKGVHVRVGLPVHDPMRRALPDGMAQVLAALSGAGFAAAAGAALGPVYRGVSENGAIVHGSAINRAARLCARAQPGEALFAEGTVPPLRPAAPSTLLVGREREQTVATTWLDAGGARMVFLLGEPGIGKTHLLRSLLEQRRGGHVHRELPIWVSCTAGMLLEPHGASMAMIREAFRQRRAANPAFRADRWAADVFVRSDLPAAALSLCSGCFEQPPKGATPMPDLPPVERAALIDEALFRLVERLSLDQRLAVAFDDFHLVDDRSRELCERILDAGCDVVAVASARPAVRERPDDRLVAHPAALALVLPPLTDRQARGLVAAASPSLGRTQVDHIVAAARGNPFHAVQAALALDEGAAASQMVFNGALDARLDHLSGMARALLRVAGILPRPLAPDAFRHVLATCGMPVDGEVDLLDGLVAAHLLRRGPLGYQIAHQLITEAVRRRMPDGVLRTLSRAAARWASPVGQGLRAPALGPPELAALWLDAGSRGRAAILNARAADHAREQGSPELAVRLYQAAIELAPPGQTLVALWRAELAAAQWALGHVAEANFEARACQLAARRARGPRQRTARSRGAAIRAETGQFMGRLGEVISGNVTVMRDAGKSERQLAQGRGYASLGYLLALLRLRTLADRVFTAGSLLGGDGGDRRPAAYVYTARAVIELSAARWSRGERALAEARAALADWPHEHQLHEVIETTCGIAAHLQGDGHRALVCFAALRRRAARRRHRLHQGWAEYATAQTLLAMARPAQAWERLLAAEELLRGTADRQSRHICLGLRARIAWELGAEEEALLAAQSAGAMARSLPPTNYSSLEGYAAAPLIGALAARRSPQAATLYERHVADLRRYARVFPIARPRLALVRAIRRGETDPTGARALAARYGMPFEAKLISSLGSPRDSYRPLIGDPFRVAAA